MTTFLIFQGSASYNQLVGTVKASDIKSAQKQVVSKLENKYFESVEVDEDTESIFFTAYFPANQEDKDVSELDIIASKFGKRNNEEGGDYKWTTVYYSLLNADEYGF